MTQIPLQPASEDIYRKKYQLMDREGNPVDVNLNATFRRVAKALASVEKKPAQWEELFYWAMTKGAIPAGRITSNVGTQDLKASTSTINCVVSRTVGDSIEGILDAVRESGISLAAGCGIGYDFTTLRPQGAFIAGVGASTCGPLGFMSIYDSMCKTIASAGGRRGAQMGTLDICHPDIEEFITAKRENGVLRQFNLSVLITDEFMEAVKANLPWKLYFPANRKQSDRGMEVIWKPWPSIEDYMTTEEGLVKCLVYKTVSATELWNKIMTSTYMFAEPGFILIDEMNRMNNNWFCENIRATNPCGEQGLPPYGSCLLGSVNLTSFVRMPFTSDAWFDFNEFSKVVKVFTRMLDNVVELNGLRLPEQRQEIEEKRRHGMGYLGLASAMSMLGMKYGDEASVKFTEEVTKALVFAGWKTAVELAKEKGEAPILKKEFRVSDATAHKLRLDHERLNVTVLGYTASGRYLFTQSKYMQRLFEEMPELEADILRYGVRFTHHSSIAPTGTISLSIGNNASNGIEPSFAHEYTRNVIRDGKATKEAVQVYSYEALLWRSMFPDQPMPEFSTSDSVSPEDHLRIQAVAQKWIDSSISKTINVPTGISFEDFSGIYLKGYEAKLKGCTTFRFNPEAHQGVLVKKEDLDATVYRFETDTGEVIEATGSEQIQYRGEVHNAANLFDAIKEGNYGKY